MEIETFVDTLNPEQQPAAFDLLWQSLAADPRTLTSPAWHGGVLTANPSDQPATTSLTWANRFSEIARGLALEGVAIHDVLRVCDAIALILVAPNSDSPLEARKGLRWRVVDLERKKLVDITHNW